MYRITMVHSLERYSLIVRITEERVLQRDNNLSTVERILDLWGTISRRKLAEPFPFNLKILRAIFKMVII